MVRIPKDDPKKQEEREKLFKELGKDVDEAFNVSPVQKNALQKAGIKLPPSCISRMIKGEESQWTDTFFLRLLRGFIVFDICEDKPGAKYWFQKFRKAKGIDENKSFEDYCYEQGREGEVVLIELENKKAQPDQEARIEHQKYTTIQEIPVTPPSKVNLIGAYTDMLYKLLTAFPGKYRTFTNNFESVMIESLIELIYALLSPQEKEVFRWLGIFQPYFTEGTAITVCSNAEDLLEKDFLTVLEALRQYNILEVIPQRTHQYMQFYHSALQYFALKKLKEANGYESMMSSYLCYYNDLFTTLLLQRYGLGLSADRLAKSSAFLLLTYEKPNFYHAIETMREERQNYIKEKMIELYYEEDAYEEALYLSEISADLLTDEEKAIVEDFEKNSQRVAAQPDCPYPRVEWYWKYIEYELNPKYFETPNAFAETMGRLCINYAVF